MHLATEKKKKEKENHKDVKIQIPKSVSNAFSKNHATF